MENEIKPDRFPGLDAIATVRDGTHLHRTSLCARVSEGGEKDDTQERKELDRERRGMKNEASVGITVEDFIIKRDLYLEMRHSLLPFLFIYLSLSPSIPRSTSPFLYSFVYLSFSYSLSVAHSSSVYQEENQRQRRSRRRKRERDSARKKKHLSCRLRENKNALSQINMIKLSAGLQRCPMIY